MQFPSDFSRRRALLLGLAVGAAAAVPATYALLAPDRDAAPELCLACRLDTYADHFPRHGGYRAPRHAERNALAGAVEDILGGDVDSAEQRLLDVNYRLLKRRLATSDRDVVEVAEPIDTGRGWGRIYIDLSRPVRWSVQIPHPRSDLHTELIGADLFARVPGGVLLLAGAPRDAARGRTADMAHRRLTVFNAVCDVLVARSVPALQIHGFADASFPGHDIVLSTGPADVTPTVRSAARTLSAAGFTVCRAWSEDCGRLEGKTNVQAGTAADLGVDFLHVENSHTLRADPVARARLVTVLGEIARGW